MRTRRFAAMMAVVSCWTAATVVQLAPTSAQVSSTGAAARAGFSPGAGILWASDADMARELDASAATGAKWIRLDFDWPSIESARSVYSWAATDRVVEAARARGMQVIALPSYTPAWARPSGTTSKHPPTKPEDFAAFVKSAVQRYASRVSAWEIWNEPNISPFWAPRPDPVAYTALLKAAAAAVRAVDPTTTVISGGLSPATDAADGSQIAPVTFLQRVYAAGGRASFDAVGMHPYSFPAHPMDASTASWNTFYRLPLVYDVMVDNGDGGKKIWSTEYGAPTGTSSQAVTEEDQASMVKAAYDAIAQWPWAGPLLWYAGRDAGTNVDDREQNFGLLRHSFTEKPAMSAFTEAMVGTGSTTTIAPSLVTVKAGSAATGGITSLVGDDNAYYAVNSTTKGSRTVAWTASFSRVPNDLGTIQLNYRGKASLTCSQSLSLWNWLHGRWSNLDTRSIGTTEMEIAGLSPVGSASDFVSGNSGEGEVKARLICSTKAGDFVTHSDLLQITVRA